MLLNSKFDIKTLFSDKLFVSLKKLKRSNLSYIRAQGYFCFKMKFLFTFFSKYLIFDNFYTINR